LFTIGGLIEPLPVGGFLDRRGELDALHRAVEGDAPRVDVFAEGAASIRSLFAVDDRAVWQTELPGERWADSPGQGLRGLDLLDDRERLGLGAAAGAS
jgi:hypothetical protein